MYTIIIPAVIAISLSIMPATITYSAPVNASVSASVNAYKPPERVEMVKVDTLLESIVWCESRGNSKAINVNKNGTKDYGKLQVNSIHKERMIEMGLDIENPDHSFKFGLLLYEEQGTKPWYSSKKCWQNS